MTEPAVDREKVIQVSPWAWAYYNRIQLHSGPWSPSGHEYLTDIMDSQNLIEYVVKGSQMGFTVAIMLWGIHASLYGKLPSGMGVVFPTGDTVKKFAKDRWNPLIQLNPLAIGQYVSGDSMDFKQISKTNVHFRGAKATSKIEGKKTSIQAKEWSADALIFDEKDEMEKEMVGMMLKRLGHAEADGILGRAYIRGLSTPMIPGYGIEEDYAKSSQHIWMIKCEKCGKENCLELTFPECLHMKQDGSVVRLCTGCHDRELDPRQGYWIARYPDKQVVGRWISRLNSVYADLGKILDCYENPQKYEGGLQELYNSELARGYIAAENKLEPHDVYKCCSWDSLLPGHDGPACAGIDVGHYFHVVIGIRPNETALKVIGLYRVTEIEDVYDICKRFNVQCAVMDLEPEPRTGRSFQKAVDFPVWLCDEQGTRKKPAGWNEDEMLLSMNRTEGMDNVIHVVRNQGQLVLPKRCEEVDRFAQELSNTAKVRDEDKVTGSVKYTYKKLGDDHYFHALLFALFASDHIPTLTAKGTKKDTWWSPAGQTRGEGTFDEEDL